MVKDIIVIGGGPGGYCAAERAAAAGKAVTLFEKRALGGVCLNEGCIPSKALLHSAKIYDYAMHGRDYGVTVEGASIDQKKVIARKDKIVKKLVAGVGMKMKKHGVEVVNGDAAIKGRVDGGFAVECDGKEFLAKQLIIATGSSPMLPPIDGLMNAVESGFAMTNREVLALTTIPESMVVIGGGVIGLEMASYYNSVGSKVTVVEMLNSIGGPIDADIAENLLANYKKKGIEFRLGCKVTSIGEDGVTFEDGKEKVEVKGEKVLLSIGRRPNTANIGLETLDIYTDRGAVVTDDYMRTNVEGVYAIGDVNGKIMLAHTAYREAEVAVNNIVGKGDIMEYGAIPSVIYTNPEVAAVGETEQSAKQKGYDCECIQLPMAYSGRYLAENEKGDGFIKLVYDKKNECILGVSMVGNSSSESIYGAALMIGNRLPIDGIKKLVFPHPTVCEIIREALFEIE